MKEYFLDKRSLVSGRKSGFLSGLVNYLNLNELITSVIYGVTNSSIGSLLFQNGLTSTLTNNSYEVKLGGNLIEDTTIEGTGAYEFNVLNTSKAELQGETAILSGTGQTKIVTPDVSTSGSVVGQVLTLTNTDGTVEFQTPSNTKYVREILTSDWDVNQQIIILASVHNKGINPIVQVQDDSGLIEVPTSPINQSSNGLLADITVALNGDVTLTYDSASFNGKVVII